MSIKKYFGIFGIILTAVIMLGYMINWYVQFREISEILNPVKSHNFAGAEQQVVRKIMDLVKKTETDPDLAGSWGRLGMNLYIHDYIGLAVPCFKKAHEIDDQDFRWPYFCGVALDELNSGQATEWYKRSKLLKPAYPPLCVKLGNRYLLAGQLEKAKESFESVVNSNIGIPHIYLGLAKILIEKNQLDNAKDYLSKALELAPEFREAHALLAEIHRREGERSKAEAEFERMKNLPPRLDLSDPIYYEMVNEGVSSFWYQVRGNNFIKSENLTAALNEFKKALQAKPNQVSFTSLGSVYQLQKRDDAAMEQYHAALELDSNYVDALNNLGIIHFNRGDVNKAISLVERALKIQPESIDCYLNLGSFYKHKGEDKKAAKYFREGLIHAPDDSRFAYQLSWLLAASPVSSIRNGKEAVRRASQLCEQTGYKNAAIVDLLAAAFAEDAQFKKAETTAQQAHVIASSTGNHSLADDINERIKLYRNKHAYRQR